MSIFQPHDDVSDYNTMRARRLALANENQFLQRKVEEERAIKDYERTINENADYDRKHGGTWESRNPKTSKVGRAVGSGAKAGLGFFGSVLKAGFKSGSKPSNVDQAQTYENGYKHYNPDRYVDEHRGRVQDWKQKSIFQNDKYNQWKNKSVMNYGNDTSKYQQWKNKGIFDYGGNKSNNVRGSKRGFFDFGNKPRESSSNNVNKKGFFDFGKNSKSKGKGFFDW